MPLRVGDPAPDLHYTSPSGEQRRLRDLRGNKRAVVYFYPSAFTSVCTRETCGFRDAHDELASRDTEIIGVSVDDEARHREFSAAHQVPFAMVADPTLAVSRAWGATGLFTRISGKTNRITYVVDERGLIIGVFDSLLRASHHVDGVRALVARQPPIRAPA